MCNYLDPGWSSWIKRVLIGSYYCPPSSDRDYLINLRDSLDKIQNPTSYNIWIGGDFNLGDIVWENQSVNAGAPKLTLCRDLINLSNDFGLDQFVTEPTCGKRILDLFFTTNPTLVTKSVVLPGISDHNGIPKIEINCKTTSTKQKPRKVYICARTNLEGLKAGCKAMSDEFLTKDLSCVSVEDLWEEFRHNLTETVEENTPSKVVPKRNNTPWINQRIKWLHRRKQRAYNSAKKKNRQEAWDSYKELRHKIKK